MIAGNKSATGYNGIPVCGNRKTLIIIVIQYNLKFTVLNGVKRVYVGALVPDFLLIRFKRSPKNTQNHKLFKLYYRHNIMFNVQQHTLTLAHTPIYAVQTKTLSPETDVGHESIKNKRPNSEIYDQRYVFYVVEIKLLTHSHSTPQ